MVKFPRVIVITGSPGVGKSVISKALAEKLRGFYVSLSEIVEREELVLTVDFERDTVVADLDKLRDKVSQIIQNASLDVIVDGHYAPYIVPSSLVSYSFVLRMEPYKLEKRLRARGYNERKVLENMVSEILDVCLVDAISEYRIELVDEIDVTEMHVQGVVEEILKVLDGQRKSRVGVVDWLGILEKEGRLDKVLSLLDKLED